MEHVGNSRQSSVVVVEELDSDEVYAVIDSRPHDDVLFIAEDRVAPQPPTTCETFSETLPAITNNEECPICFEKIERLSILCACHHLFCLRCVCIWLQHKDTCPICRCRVKSIIYDVRSRDEYSEKIVYPIAQNPNFVNNLLSAHASTFGFAHTNEDAQNNNFNNNAQNRNLNNNTHAQILDVIAHDLTFNNSAQNRNINNRAHNNNIINVSAQTRNSDNNAQNHILDNNPARNIILVDNAQNPNLNNTAHNRNVGSPLSFSLNQNYRNRNLNNNNAQNLNLNTSSQNRYNPAQNNNLFNNAQNRLNDNPAHNIILVDHAQNNNINNDPAQNIIIVDNAHNLNLDTNAQNRNLNNNPAQNIIIVDNANDHNLTSNAQASIPDNTFPLQISLNNTHTRLNNNYAQNRLRYNNSPNAQNSNNGARNTRMTDFYPRHAQIDPAIQFISTTREIPAAQILPANQNSPNAHLLDLINAAPVNPSPHGVNHRRAIYTRGLNRFNTNVVFSQNRICRLRAISLISEWIRRDIEAILPYDADITRIVEDMIRSLTGRRRRYVSLDSLNLAVFKNLCSQHLGRFSTRFLDELNSFFISGHSIRRYDFTVEYR